MNKNRIEALNDRLIAIIITIIVLKMKMPHKALWEAINNLLPVLISYNFELLICWNLLGQLSSYLAHLTEGKQHSYLGKFYAFVFLSPFLCNTG